jgi:hypothetical protein
MSSDFTENDLKGSGAYRAGSLIFNHVFSDDMRAGKNTLFPPQRLD